MKDKEVDVQLIFMKYLSDKELIVEVGLQEGNLEKGLVKGAGKSLKKDHIRELDAWFRLVDTMELIIGKNL